MAPSAGVGPADGRDPGQGLLVFGRTGQLAHALRRAAPAARLADRSEADLTRPDECAALIRAARPAAVINAAAFTAVDRAEAETEAAWLVNAEAPAAMAAACAALGIPFLHVSTDYVFDGSGNRPWREGDAPAPLNAYGATKLAGEAGVAAAGGQWAILRTAWVFGAEGGDNFVRTVLRLADHGRPRLGIVSDQVGGPTPAADLGRALLKMAAAMRGDPGKGGIYHFAGAPEVSRADFARAILAAAGRTTPVDDIASADYPTPARRPANARLDCSAILRDFGIERPDWRRGLAAVLAEWRQQP